MLHLFTPGNTDPQVLEKGKIFLEKLLLNRTVGIKLARVDQQGNFVGRIYHPNGDIASEILKNGLSKLDSPKELDQLDWAYFQQLKGAQKNA